MIPEKLTQILNHEGVAAIVTQGANEPHVVNTWHSYIKVTGDGRMLFPVGGMNTTESNINKNNNILLTVGSREVEGTHGMGAGFLVNGFMSILSQGADFDDIKQRFPWARAAGEVKVNKATETL